jgi:hypothetical protein
MSKAAKAASSSSGGESWASGDESVSRYVAKFRPLVEVGSGRRVEMALVLGDRFVRESLGGFGVICCLWLKGRGFRSWIAERGGGLVEARCRRWRRGLGLRVGLGDSVGNGVVVLVSWRDLMLCL